MIFDRYDNRSARREIETELLRKAATASLEDVRRLVSEGAKEVSCWSVF